MRYSRALLILLPITVITLTGKAYYDTNSIDIRHFQLRNSPLGDSLAGIKLAFLTDLHTKEIGPREIKILDILEKEKPDLLLLGGDYIRFRSSYESVLSFFAQIKKAYAVMGNIDYSNENGSCILCHREKSKDLREHSQPTFLRNSSVVLIFRGKGVNLVGVDDPVEKRSNLEAAIQKIDRSLPTILVAHSPEIFEEAARRGIDLVLSGHNHGGQIFLMRYLRKVIPVESALEYLDGYFQKGKTLMYVSRGIGTSFLPFRLGEKPEITFFEFSRGPEDMKNSFQIIDNSAHTVFAGISLTNFYNFINVLGVLDRPSKVSPLPSGTGTLFDFEKEAELESLNWECHKWFGRSPDHASSGKYSLQVTLPPGHYPGIHFRRIHPDWSGYRHFKMEIFNPAAEPFALNVRIDDAKSGWEYANRYDGKFMIQNGKNTVSIPISSIQTNINPRPLDMRHIKRLMLFISGNQKKVEFFLDHVRLE